MSQTNPHQARIGMSCPHCRGPARIRSSRPVTLTYRQLNCACLDVQCGFTFGADIEITHMISPSARPNPDVQLRAVPRRTRRPANDDHARGPEVPPHANDDDRLGEAI